MNKKRVASMLLVATTTTTGAILADNTYASAANQNSSSSIEARGILHEKGKVINVETNLRLRSDKNTNSNIIGYLREGQNFDVLAKEGSWYKIKVDGKTGYVYEEYVEIISSSSSARISEKGVVINITSNLRVRSGASTSSSTLGYLKNGDKLDIVSKSGSWYKIKYKSSYGYVHQDYVKVTNSNNNSNSGNNNNTSKPEKTEKGVVVNITTNLRVRSSASTSSSTLGYLVNGDKLDIVSKSGSWYKIKYKSSYGYVHQDYVKVTNSNNNSNNNNNSSSTNKIEGTGKVINITSNLRVRKGPGTNYGVVGYLLNGDNFEVTSKEGSWYKIKKGNLVGYISQDYVKFYPKENKPEQKPEQKPEITKSYGKVNVSSELRIREKANTSSKIIGNLRNNEIVDILGEENNFYKIKSGNITGYSSKDYIKKISEDEANEGSQLPENSDVTYTNYNMSMDAYINSQVNALNGAYNYDYFEKYINPAKATNQSQFMRLDKYRNVNVSALNDYLNRNDSGVLKGQGQSFANAAKSYNIDPVYFVAQSIHETGYGKSRLASGVTITEIANQDKPIKNSKGELTGYEMIKLDKPVTVYNLFGIGAYDNLPTFTNRALILGTTYAYNKGWTSVDKAISGAAKFVSDNYINSSSYRQNTLYKMRFNQNQSNMWHQYATTPWYAENIGAQIEEMKYLYGGGTSFSYDKPKFTESKKASPRGFAAMPNKDRTPASQTHVSIDDM